MPLSIVYNQDCMEGMKQYPDKHFELAIVDPPYGLGDVNHTDSKHIHSKIEWNNKIPEIKYFNELFRISKNQIIWGVNYYFGLIPHSGRIVHDKSPSNKQYPNLSDGDIASHSFGNNIRIFRYEWRGNVQGAKINWKNQGIDARIHPTQKPVPLYKWILNNYAKKGDKILDTHIGSGSSRIAAYDMDFDFTGYEIDKKYYQAQEKRFNEFKKQLKIF